MKRILFILIVATLLLCGCDFRTASEMYTVPARPAADYDLQNAINSAMSGLDYAAPKSGINQQIVQTADLDGNGDLEYLLFARGGTEHPLQIFIFDKQKDTYNLVDTISFNGTAFDRVEYVQMDDRPGMEIVVGYQLNDRLTGGLCVYSFQSGNMVQVIYTTYTQFLTTDLNSDGKSELFTIRPGQNEWAKGIVELYSVVDGEAERSVELNLSVPSSNIRQVMQGELQDGQNCVYVSGKTGETTLSTDIFAICNDALVNVVQSANISTAVSTIGNYFVDITDFDGDNIVELPKLQDMVQVTQEGISNHKVIVWYTLDCAGKAYDKVYTYHCYADGWFIELEPEWAAILTVSRQGKRVDFFWWDHQYGVPVRLFSINVLTGQDREELADEDGNIRLHTTTGAVFVGELTDSAGEYGITEAKLKNYFHMIQQDI